MTKRNPFKNCSCIQCRAGKKTRGGHREMKADKRKFRHDGTRQICLFLKGYIDSVEINPISNYYD